MPRWAASRASSPASGFPRGAAGRRQTDPRSAPAHPPRRRLWRVRARGRTRKARWRGASSNWNCAWRASSAARGSARSVRRRRNRRRSRSPRSPHPHGAPPQQRERSPTGRSTCWRRVKAGSGHAISRCRQRRCCRRFRQQSQHRRRQLPSPANRLRAWLAGGNALTRIGVVILFFGVAFLLKYFTERFTMPIELRLAMVAGGGFALTALGMRLAASRPGYGLSLQGAGAGILYLTAYAAFRLYGVLPEAPAVVLLIAVSALTVWLAVRNDSQPLAGLAIAGGFLAPVLVGNDGGPVLLFGYFALLNAAIFALAWSKAWRVLNAVGFAFTFVLGLVWGHEFYRAGTLRDRAAVPGAVLRLLRRDRDSLRAARAARRTRSGGRSPGVRRSAGRVRIAGRARARFRVRRGVERARAGDRLCAALPGPAPARANPVSRCCRARSLCWPSSSRPSRFRSRSTIAGRPRSGRSRRRASTGSARGRTRGLPEPSRWSSRAERRSRSSPPVSATPTARCSPMRFSPGRC